LFALAELQFFHQGYDSALALYGRIEQTPESEFANDAIERMTTIQLNRKDTTLLGTFATASLLAVQSKTDEAVRQFDELASQKLNTDLAEVSLMKSIELSAQRKDIAGVHKRVQNLAQLNAESIYADKALLLDAEMSAAEGNNQQALQSYQELLAKFPRSLYIQDARERVRKLRGGM
jgi:outer membrane protein assembly factor BamD (BamD/ComL family)